MSTLFRTFAYTRVSTIDQIPENQIREIETAGFAIESHRVIAKTVSGWRAIAQRKGVRQAARQDGKGRCAGYYQDRPGIMAMNVIINAVAQSERNRLVGEKIESGKTVSAIARQSNTNRQIIMSVRRHA